MQRDDESGGPANSAAAVAAAGVVAGAAVIARVWPWITKRVRGKPASACDDQNIGPVRSGGGGDPRSGDRQDGAGDYDNESTFISDVESSLDDLLREHDVDPVHGFLPWPPPLQRLPCERSKHFVAWEEIVEEIPNLLAAGQFREEADRRLGRFPVHLLKGDREFRRAMNVLSTVAHAYVWGNSFKLSNDTMTENCQFLRTSSSSSISEYSSESDSEHESDFSDEEPHRRRPARRHNSRLALMPRRDSEPLAALVLPNVIAKPWLSVCERVGRPPVLSHASYVLDNWRLIDEGASPASAAAGPAAGSAPSTASPPSPAAAPQREHLITRSNVTALSYFLGGMDEMEFILRTVEIEEVGAIGVIAAVRSHIVIKRIVGGEISAEHALPLLVSACRDIRVGLEDMTRSMHHLPKRCDPYIFYTRVRPFLSGWKGNPVMPDGLMFGGYGRYKFHGGSAAQSSTLAIFDTILGVQHSNSFLMDMRTYMPPKHRHLLEKIGSVSSLREYAEASEDTVFRAEFNKVLGALEAFRNAHLGIVRLYIINPSKRLNNFKDNAGSKGTGGTDLISFLKPLRDETVAAKVD